MSKDKKAAPGARIGFGNIQDVMALMKRRNGLMPYASGEITGAVARDVLPLDLRAVFDSQPVADMLRDFAKLQVAEIDQQLEALGFDTSTVI